MRASDQPAAAGKSRNVRSLGTTPRASLSTRSGPAMRAASARMVATARIGTQRGVGRDSVMIRPSVAGRRGRRSLCVGDERRTPRGNLACRRAAEQAEKASETRSGPRNFPFPKHGRHGAAIRGPYRFQANGEEGTKRAVPHPRRGADSPPAVRAPPRRPARAPERHGPRGSPGEDSPARAAEMLFRIHLTYPGFYARARRQFGSWQGAVLAAGVSYQEIVVRARSRSLSTRSQRRRRVRGASG